MLIPHVVLVALEAEAASKQSQRSRLLMNIFRVDKFVTSTLTLTLLHIGLHGFAPGQNLGAYFLQCHVEECVHIINMGC